ncbi:hypothetical protein LEP1GSC165_2399 [Leptospira santarosai str. CBC523]|uniref:hypothetical protein n=1 Tax=Leptospira santarosai TaxID=28183 RepID=UPI0002BF1931|nr:hypothetical protein [Leptospira santarosai]EMO14596.1 hypothetical protein LEP1GSC165_2399 [Leptospira santarosai str. CBC523]
MKQFKILVCMILVFLSFSVSPKEKEVEYKLNKQVGEIAPGVYEIGDFGPGLDDIQREKVLIKEILPDVLKFRDAYFTGDLEGLLGSLSDEYYDKLKVNYNSRKKKGEILIKSRKEMREIYKREVLTCTEDKDLGFGLCDFLKNRENAIKNRVKILARTYESEKFKNHIAAFVIAFVELDNNNPGRPYAQEFAFVKEKGKFKVFDNRQENELCVFCYYQHGEEMVKDIFNSIKQANELK